MEVNEESRMDMVSRPRSKSKPNRVEKDFRYNLYALLSTKQTYEGELSRNVER